MRALTRLVGIVGVLLLAVSSADAQLNVYNVNTSAFPKITADYVAFDGQGNVLEGLTAADFTVTETPFGGSPVDLKATVRHSCVDIVGDPAASIILVVDNSNSMRNEAGNPAKPRLDWVKDALKAFVDRVRFNGQTSVAIMTFSGDTKIYCDWSTTAAPLKSGIDTLKLGTATKYELPFEFVPNVYDMFESRNPSIPKYVFFLTDGNPSPLMDKPQEFIDRNVAKMTSLGIRFFGVSFLVEPAHYIVDQLARGTGGKSILANEKNIFDIYSNLALETQKRSICTLEWTSPYVCSMPERDRTAVVTLLKNNNPTATVQYQTPPISVAEVDVSDPVLYCGDPDPNNVSFANVTIEAKGAPLTVTGHTVTPNTYFRVVNWDATNAQPNSLPFTLQPGVKRTIRVEFRQGASKTFRQAILALEGTTCPPDIVLVAGTDVVFVQAPNGGELFSTCEKVKIKWVGVLPTQPVTIEYSDDNGTRWNTITTTATGLSYDWTPPSPGTRYLIRISVSPAKKHDFAIGVGGAGNEIATSIAICPNGATLFATGSYEGPSQFDPTNTVGDTDGYFVKLDNDGRIVKTSILAGSASNEEKIIGVVVDKDCNYYVAGYTSSPSVRFEGQDLTLPSLTTRRMFVMAFKADGSFMWQGYGEGDGVSASYVDATNIGILETPNNPPVIYVSGNFQRFIRCGLNAIGQMQQSNRYNNNNNRPYYVTFDGLGYPRLFEGAAPTNPAIKWKTMKVQDQTGYEYETGTFTGAKVFGTAPNQIAIGSKGGSDVFFSKFGAPPASSDVSDAVFSVEAPVLTVNPSSISAPTPVAVGQTITFSQSMLRNTGNFPVEITEATLIGAHPGDFRLLTPLVGLRLAPGAVLTVEFEFKPTAAGKRTAILDIKGTCGTSGQISMDGDGLPPCTWEATNVDFGKIALGTTPAPSQTVCVLKNLGPNPLSGTMTATGATGDFTITGLGVFTIPGNGGCHNITVTANATSGGQKIVNLAFGIPAECGVPNVTIRADVVEPIVRIDTVILVPQRVLTPRDTAIYIRNLNTEPADITNVTFTADANFPVVSPQGTPFTIPANGTARIPVRYTPTARGPHSISVFVTVRGQQNQLEGIVRGTGILPAIDATGHTFTAWTVNQQHPNDGTVTVSSVDATTPLVIYGVEFVDQTQTDFAWVGAVPSGFPITVRPGDPPLTFPVSFTPRAVGQRSTQVRILHDAKPGPDPIPPYAETLVDVVGVGIPASSLPPLDFGDVLSCATKTLTLEIVNANTQEPLTCQAPVATGDVGAFAVSETADFVVPPGSRRTVTVTFQPPAPGQYSANFSFANDQALDLVVNVSGRGITANASVAFDNIPTGIIGQVMAIPIRSTVGDLDTFRIRDVTITMSYPQRYMRFNSIGTPSDPNWQWTPTTGPGSLTLTGTTQTGTLPNGSIFVTPLFDVYLTADSTLPISVVMSTPYDCIVTSGSTGTVTMSLVCYAQGRLVNFSRTQASMALPAPNPSDEQTVIQYSTGIECATRFDIIDVTGNIVKQIQTPRLPSASYELHLETFDLGTGQYMLRMTSGPSVFTVPLSVRH